MNAPGAWRGRDRSGQHRSVVVVLALVGASMLSCLAIGLASGAGLLHLAAAGAALIVGVLWVMEWREPWPAKGFERKAAK